MINEGMVANPHAGAKQSSLFESSSQQLSDALDVAFREMEAMRDKFGAALLPATPADCGPECSSSDGSVICATLDRAMARVQQLTEEIADMNRRCGI